MAISIYERKGRWKLYLFLTAATIIFISLLYNNYLAGKLATQERARLQLWADAYNEIKKNNARPSNPNDCEFSFLTTIIRDNTTIPVILTNEKGEISTWRNLFRNELDLSTDSAYLYKQLAAMKATHEPIEIVSELSKIATNPTDAANLHDIKQYIYYNDSFMLYQLKIYPFVQLFIFAFFALIAYVAFNTARKAEQNKVWLGMAKETAHQLGTPLTSMVGWVELLKDSEEEGSLGKMAGDELEKDVSRLQLIAERFSKIGSEPKLVEHNVTECVEQTVKYMKDRAPKRVFFAFENEQPIMAHLNRTLFDWVIENLLKNALDAMEEGQGNIAVTMVEESEDVIIEVSDTGKGIPKSKFTTVFEPGYSTKKRGWGLGLSLSKRIMEINHKGKIFVKDSSPNGTTFRVVLPKGDKA